MAGQYFVVHHWRLASGLRFIAALVYSAAGEEAGLPAASLLGMRLVSGLAVIAIQDST